MTTADIAKARDYWVEKNRKDGESESAARARFWKEHPDIKAKSRSSQSKLSEEIETLSDRVAKSLDAYIGRAQIQREIEGRYGSLSTPRDVQRAKLKAAWWQSPDGLVVKAALRERGTVAADKVLKSAADPVAKILARLEA